ncbi:cytochrome-c peroxidase [Nitrosophilus kaiyonis]|uniref:cytochrome-c peroxidase n=1 Tax=Nitrosophilus kaiyonis TaxID=2930200 RepID=UPI002493102D|nr:cytochrome c peroxidase [Nitrosophilus kaiyonis]
MYKIFLFFILFFSSLYAEYSETPITPITESKYNLQKQELGKILFFDPNLSKDKLVSCATCHKKEFGGSNGKAKGIGVFGKVTKYNVPSIYNLSYQYVYGWENRKYSIKKKIEEVMRDKNIMDADFDEIIKYIKSNRYLKRKFLTIYSKIDKKNIIDALYNYVISLTTPNSKFDLYLIGKEKLTKNEAEGYELFKRFGCIACHNGKSVGGHMYYQYGYFLKSKNKKFIKCPSLRNVELTSPYFHDGKLKTLKEAVKWMAKIQLGREITDNQAKLIVDFLKTLTGKLND